MLVTLARGDAVATRPPMLLSCRVMRRQPGHIVAPWKRTGFLLRAHQQTFAPAVNFFGVAQCGEKLRGDGLKTKHK